MYRRPGAVFVVVLGAVVVDWCRPRRHWLIIGAVFDAAADALALAVLSLLLLLLLLLRGIVDSFVLVVFAVIAFVIVACCCG